MSIAFHLFNNFPLEDIQAKLIEDYRENGNPLVMDGTMLND